MLKSSEPLHQLRRHLRLDVTVQGGSRPGGRAAEPIRPSASSYHSYRRRCSGTPVWPFQPSAKPSSQ